MLKNTLLYYLLILLPVAGLIYLSKHGYDTALVICLFVYLLIYRGIVDGIRLYQKGVIPKRKNWTIIFSWRMQYFKALYLP